MTVPLVRWAVIQLAPLALWGSSAAAQSAPQVTLDTPQRAFAEPFSSVAGLRELPDGRLIVADRLEQRVVLLDPERDSVTPLGRVGGGPGEYRLPAGLFRYPDDATLLMDMGNRRFTVIAADGRLTEETFPLRHPRGFPLLVRGVDREGRLYFDLAGMMLPGLRESAVQGVAPILRSTPGASTLDTLASVTFPPMEPTGPGEVRVRIGGGRRPFQPQDAWAVSPDGWVGIARTDPYRVEWITISGAPIRGPAVTYEPVPIGRAEKEAWADAQTRGIVVREENGRRQTTAPPRPEIDQQAWPAHLPPFVGRNVFAAPSGELWVERSRPARVTRRLYDVFDRRGRLARQVLVPPDCRIVELADRGIYVVRTDQDDLQWLERYGWK